MAHQNDNPSDNRLANLAWETKPKNRGVLSGEAVANIRQRVAAGERQVALAREYGVTKATICLIVNGKRRAASLSGGAQ